MDPVSADAQHAIEHLNDDHADALLSMAQALGGFPKATAASCTGADREGLDLLVTIPEGEVAGRVFYADPIADASGLRAATVELAKRSRALLSE